MSAPIKLTALKQGDTIGVFAPSSWVEREDIEKSATTLEKRGYKVFIHPQTYERENQSAGNHLQKALAFQGLWQRKDISAIWAAGGGNRCLHLTDTINFERLKSTPKPLIGFSDVTALLNAVYAHTNIPSIHGPVFKNIHKYNDLNDLLNLLEGKTISYTVTKENILHEGTARGNLIGGNLSLFQYLPQTLPKNFWEKGILFLEDCNEELSRIDRMILHLKRLGIFSSVNAIIFGEFTSIQECGKPFGYTLKDIITEHTDGLNIPIFYNMPFGHGKNFAPMPIGIQAEIDTNKKIFKTTQSLC
ncbi:MAG: S66 peptidase family protein [Alphaproteobacteria bacterium]